MFCLEGQQPHLEIFFRGGGRRTTDDEKLSHPPGVDIYFQTKKMPGWILAFVWNGEKKS